MDTAQYTWILWKDSIIQDGFGWVMIAFYDRNKVHVVKKKQEKKTDSQLLNFFYDIKIRSSGTVNSN